MIAIEGGTPFETRKTIFGALGLRRSLLQRRSWQSWKGITYLHGDWAVLVATANILTAGLQICSQVAGDMTWIPGPRPWPRRVGIKRTFAFLSPTGQQES